MARAARPKKFDEMVEFARALPQLRERVEHDLSRDDLSRERVLGGAVRMLDLGSFRIGSEGYAEENETYGLATIRKDHVIVADRFASSGTRPRAARTARSGSWTPTWSSS
jgi:DNA topoisomerase IB